MSNCWDVHNPDSLTHGQGGDAGGIISMVNYTLDKYSGDRERVYVMGFSSGGMMTNVMAGSYPDVFEAGAAYSGVAFGCFQGKSPIPRGRVKQW
jgi:poly(3-hydroxybutyrate) depolymerase